MFLQNIYCDKKSKYIYAVFRPMLVYLPKANISPEDLSVWVCWKKRLLMFLKLQVKTEKSFYSKHCAARHMRTTLEGESRSYINVFV